MSHDTSDLKAQFEDQYGRSDDFETLESENLASCVTGSC